ncbi:MAG: phosphotransferase [Candidatus Pristimantibacillus sp.]
MTQSDFSVYLNQYPLDSEWSIEPGESGMNNTTRMIKAGDQRYVLRVYNNHKDKQIVDLEHEVLKALYERNPVFRTPVPVVNRNESTVTTDQDGNLAALYHFIPGVRPIIGNEAHIQSLGIAAARLTEVLSAITISNKPMYQPYYLLKETYASLDEQAIREIAATDDTLARSMAKLDSLLSLRDKLSTEMNVIRNLPHQWIHGDLNFSNSVAVADEIIGILDFEFCTRDVRAMELAVVIVDLITENERLALDRIQLVCQGYGSILKLTESESDSLPILMKLRMLDITLHFATRLLENLDDSTVLARMIDQAFQAIEWIDVNEAQLRKLTYQLLVSE